MAIDSSTPLPTDRDGIREHQAHWYKQLSGQWTDGGHMSLASRLNTLANLELTSAMRQTASEIDSARAGMAKVGTNLEKTINASVEKLSTAMTASAEASDRSAKALVRWTMVLAVATLVLALLTTVLALDAAHKMGWF